MGDGVSSFIMCTVIPSSAAWSASGCGRCSNEPADEVSAIRGDEGGYP